MNFQTALKTRRKALKLTQVQLAEKIGVTQATIAGWEAGKRRPERPETIKTVASVLRIIKKVIRPDYYAA